MGLVLCLLGAIYWGVRKFLPGMLPRVTGGKNLRIVESLNLGERRSIALIEAGGQVYLIGSTPQQVNLLAALPEKASLLGEAPATEESERPQEKPIFRRLFEVEKKRQIPRDEKILPDDIRIKMRQLREALEK